MKKETFLFGLSFFALSPSENSKAAIFQDIFNYSAEVCGVSKETVGNSWGHAVIYLKGVCRTRAPSEVLESHSEPSAPWRLKICDDADPIEDVSTSAVTEKLERGVLLSANAKVSNSHWIAIPGKNLAMSGGVPADKRYDTAEMKAVWGRVLATKAYDGLKLVPSAQIQFEQNLGRSEEEYLLAEGFGTDFALTLARSASCWKIPVNKKQMEAMVNYANDLNLKPYRWNFLTANCNHLVVGILSAAKILSPVYQGAWNLLHLPKIFPIDTLVRIGKQVNGEIPTIEKVFNKKRFRDSLLEFGRLPLHYGNLWEIFPFRSYGNLAFVEHHRPWGWPGEFERVRAMDFEPSLVDFNKSLLEYSKKLERARQRLASKTQEERLRWVSKKNRSNFIQTFELYQNWLIEASDEVKKIDLSLL